MTKKDIIKAIQNITNASTSECTRFYNAFIFTITDALKKGEEVNVGGLGKFIIKQRKSRQIINPKTKELMLLPPKLSPQFKASKKFKDSIYR